MSGKRKDVILARRGDNFKHYKLKSWTTNCRVLEMPATLEKCRTRKKEGQHEIGRGKCKKGKGKEPTNIITHEQVVGVGRLSTDAKEFDEIMELTMNIATHRHRTFHRLHIPLLHKDGPRLLTQVFHLQF
jgi:hypothetical protein